jgi:hypothetical protein
MRLAFPVRGSGRSTFGRRRFCGSPESMNAIPTEPGHFKESVSNEDNNQTETGRWIAKVVPDGKKFNSSALSNDGVKLSRLSPNQIPRL